MGGEMKLLEIHEPFKSHFKITGKGWFVVEGRVVPSKHNQKSWDNYTRQIERELARGKFSAAGILLDERERLT
jgi:hypothetical protein